MFTSGISEIVLMVQDVRKAARFYQEIVGLIPEEKADDEWAWFWTGEPNQSVRLALHKGYFPFEEHSPLPEGRRWGSVHYALRVDKSKIEEALSHLKKNNITIYGPKYFEWMKATAYYFHDLDGNFVEFWVPDERG